MQRAFHLSEQQEEVQGGPGIVNLGCVSLKYAEEKK